MAGLAGMAWLWLGLGIGIDCQAWQSRGLALALTAIQGRAKAWRGHRLAGMAGDGWHGGHSMALARHLHWLISMAAWFGIAGLA